MTPYATRFISEDDLALFSRIKKAVEQMNDPDLGVDEQGVKILLSCHVLARAVARIFPVQVRDGYFADSYEHSWLETKSGHLIDLYPVATIGGPVMIDGQTPLSPSHRIYTRTSARKISQGRFGQNSFRRSVRRVTKTLLSHS